MANKNQTQYAEAGLSMLDLGYVHTALQTLPMYEFSDLGTIRGKRTYAIEETKLVFRGTLTEVVNWLSETESDETMRSYVRAHSKLDAE